MNFAFAIQASRREAREGRAAAASDGLVDNGGKGVKEGTKQGGKFVIMERDEENEKANEFDGS